MIKGKDVNIYVYVEGVPVAAVCATNVSTRETSGMISTLTMGGGKHRTYKPTVKDATITLEGVRTVDRPGRFQAEDFEAGNEHQIIIIYTNDYGDVLSYDMNVLITETADSNPASEFSSYSVSMVRSGPWTKLKTFDNILTDGEGEPIIDSNGTVIRVP